MPDPERVAGVGQLELLMQTANAADVTGDAARQETLLRRTLELVDERSSPSLAAAVLERLSRALWSLNRQEESVETVKRALALLPDDEQSRERAALLVELARSRMLQSRFGEAIGVAREALAVARAIGVRDVEVRALNVMGTALGNRFEAEEGAGALREALEIARESGFPREVTAAYINLADVLHVSGRTADALAVAREGLETDAPNTRAHDWLTMNAVEFSYYLGRWKEAHELLPSQSRRRYGNQLFVWHMSRGVLALGAGDLEAARIELEAMEAPARESTEPQFVGAYGWMRAELERRCGDVDAARAAVDHALDQIEYCSDDVTRIAGVAGVGVRVEADAAMLARDRRDAEAEQAALKRADEHLARLRLTGEAGGPVERAELAGGEAEHSRAVGDDDPALWAAAAAAWARPRPDVRPRLLELARRPRRWCGRTIAPRRRRSRPRRCARRASSAASGWSPSWSRSRRERACACWARPSRPAPAAAAAAAGRRAVRPDPARAAGARPGRGRRDQPRDRPRAAHGGEDRQRACVAHPGQAGRALAHRGGGGGRASGAGRHGRGGISPVCS